MMDCPNKETEAIVSFYSASILKNKIQQCGKFYNTYQSACCNAKLVRPIRCKSRFCPTCARMHQAKLLQKWWPAIEKWKNTYFFTLTIPNVTILTKEMLNKFMSDFSKLRRATYWRKAAGIYAIECTVNPENGSYHLHLHALLDRWIPIKEVRIFWNNKTDGRQMKITYIPKEGRGQSCRELLKYISKLHELTDDTLEILQEVFGHRRLISVFGRVWGVRGAKPPSILDTLETKSHKCPCCGAKNCHWVMIDRRKSWTDLLNSSSWYDFWIIEKGEAKKLFPIPSG
ncbi:MAG: protein rep [Planctomycetes bacterium]|nr:protein rep [Planctomycetota bacterium]